MYETNYSVDAVNRKHSTFLRGIGGFTSVDILIVNVREKLSFKQKTCTKKYFSRF